MQSPSEAAPDVVENLPPTHLVHWLDATAPELVRYVPAVQSVHEAAPEAAEYLPGTHDTQVLTDAAPVFPCEVPAGQAKQALDAEALV